YAGYHAEFTDKYAVYLRLHCILDAQREEAERIFTEMDECEDEEEKERYKRRIYAMFHSRHKRLHQMKAVFALVQQELA
ncbi:unnamed protein product, partial [Closterium sp. NIES-53]